MKINKKIQYSFLFCLYLSRAGRASVAGVAEVLNLSPTFLQQIARTLRIGGVVKSVKGPSGGYELQGDPTVKEIFDAVAPIMLIPDPLMLSYAANTPEKRAFAAYVTNLHRALTPLLKRKISNIGNEKVATELAQLNRANESLGH